MGSLKTPWNEGVACKSATALAGSVVEKMAAAPESTDRRSWKATDIATWGIIVVNGIGGLLVAAVIKFADNIWKGFATAGVGESTVGFELGNDRTSCFGPPTTPVEPQGFVIEWYRGEPLTPEQLAGIAKMCDPACDVAGESGSSGFSPMAEELLGNDTYEG